MKKYGILIIAMIIANTLLSQDVVFEISEKACNCLRERSKTIGSNQEECVPVSFAEVFTNTSDDIKRLLGTITGMKSTMLKVDEILSVTCYESGEESYQMLAKHYYSDSEDEVASSYFMTTQLMMNEGKYDIAAEGLEIAVSIDSTFVKAFDHLGVNYRHLKDLERSISSYKKSLQIFPIGKTALMNLGMVYALNEDDEKSNKYFQRLIDVHPNDPEGYYGIGKNYIAKDQFDLGLRNLCIAHQIYVTDDSEYQNDTEQLISIVYTLMKREGKEKLFRKLAKEYNITIK